MSDSDKSPRTQMDQCFLDMVAEVRLQMLVRSDRAMSKVLGQHDNFISRIKTGVQSVPLSVWADFDKYAKANNLTEGTDASTIEIARMSIETASVVGRFAKAIGKGDMNELLRLDRSEKQREPSPSRGAILKSPKGDFENYLEATQEKITAANEIIALLTSQLADKERTIQILLEQLPKK